MPKRLVILGGGTGGTLIANRLRRRVRRRRAEITVVDHDDRHVYQPGLLFVPFGLAEPDEIVRPRRAQLHDGIEFREAEVDRVDRPRTTVVHLRDGTALGYDVLVVATGARLLPEETEGLTGPGWSERVFTFYDLDGRRRRCATRSQRFDGGRLVVNSSTCRSSARSRRWSSASWPTGTCASAASATTSSSPTSTPLDGAFTKPVASAAAGRPARARRASSS